MRALPSGLNCLQKFLLQIALTFEIRNLAHEFVERHNHNRNKIIIEFLAHFLNFAKLNYINTK
jgi:hypothetical protein